MSSSTGKPSGSGGRRLVGLVVVGAVTLSLLAACGGSSGSATRRAAAKTPEPVPSTAAPTSTVAMPTSTAGKTASASRGSTATTTRSAERLTAASRLRLDGIGPIDVGMTLAQATAATGMNVRITSADFGTDCRYAEAEGGPAGLAFMVIGGRIVRVDVTGEPTPSPIATLSGIRVGSSEDDVMAAYPGRIQVTGHPYLETGHDLVYRSSDPALGLIFSTDGQRVVSFRSGQAGPVSAIEGCL